MRMQNRYDGPSPFASVLHEILAFIDDEDIEDEGYAPEDKQEVSQEERAVPVDIEVGPSMSAEQGASANQDSDSARLICGPIQEKITQVNKVIKECEKERK